MLTPGHVLRRRYRVEAYLGGGGFGRVYKAYDLDCNIPSRQIVAIKELYQLDEYAVRQFEREAHLLADLKHDALPTVLDYFVEGGVPYLVMVFVPGEDVGQRLKRQQRLTEAEALAIIAPILDALHYLHSHNPPILHRDIKPENLRLAPAGGVYLVDFGLAKASAVNQTVTFGIAVSRGYSPPEQYTGGADRRSDLYALGATLYKMLSGIDAMPDAIERTRQDTLKPLRRLSPDVSFKTAAAVDRLLLLDPERRYQNVASLRADLPGHDLRLPVAPPAAPAPAPRRRTLAWPHPLDGWPRRPLIGGLAAISLLLLAALLWMVNSALGRPAAAGPTASAQAIAATASALAAGSTTTAQAIVATASALKDQIVYPERNGTLVHKANDLSFASASVSLSDFNVQSTFINPYDRGTKAWNYGIFFRWTEAQRGYLLIVDSDKNWTLLYYDGSRNGDGSATFSQVDRGVIRNLDVSDKGANQLRLAAYQGQASFFVADTYIAALDVSAHQAPGNIYLFTGFSSGSRDANKRTDFEGFTVWSSQPQALASQATTTALAAQANATARVQSGVTATALAQAQAAATATAQVRAQAAATTQAVAAATARATAIAANQRLATARTWSVQTEEPFNNALRRWATLASEDQTVKPSIGGGKYTWVIQRGSWFSAPIADPGALFYVRVKARRADGPRSTYYGVILRGLQSKDDKSSHYTFKMNDEKSFVFEIVDKGSQATLMDVSRDVELKEENTIEIVVDNNHFYFYVNGRYIDEKEHAALSSGTVGVSVSSVETEASTIEFDDFLVRKP